ncbi:hypothetical protein GON03_23200 [Nocardioides sp. MAH-18]|uniref:Exo-alpha-sialidase n=1 Tax=Nocardioides agri TaxID=2682843 RepID=A0A6L6XXU9_9ACTN|nr:MULTISPECIES: hypothetical protein [unclassified Nocardioides]MBA2952938.1 hypothetical protein [Nocardioides sp. CGMCC 1.13656]MVQ52100.1 hypothetical protein [Nocardioides sp. MAH-18]
MSPALRREMFNASRAGTFDEVDVAEAVAAHRVEELPDLAPKKAGRKTTKKATKKAGRKARAVDPDELDELDGVEAKVWATNDNQRWVPIGPSVVRRGQASGRPRVIGRIRDLAVSSDGLRAYAASGMGGVWYTGDAGHSWAPIGGWTPLSPFAGGNFNPRSVGCLLVDFDPGGNPANDFVVVGTGEPPPFPTSAGQGFFGGLGVLANRGPATVPIDQNPWEARPDAEVRRFEGIGFYRMARRPGRVAGSLAAGTVDDLLAATSGGLFRGTRVAGPTYTWTRVTSVDALAGVVAGQAVSDVLWHSSGRILIAVHGSVPPGPVLPGGVAFSADNGATWTWLNGCSPLPAPGSQVQGRSSLADVPGTNTVYVLTPLPPPAVANPPTDTPAVFQIPNVTAGTPAATAVGNVPAALWGGQAWYDQAIVADRVAGVDRLYLGGNFFQDAAGDFLGGVWCFDVAAGPALAAVNGISTTAAPAPPLPIAGAGADAAGLVGNNIHPDIHTIRLAGAAGARHVWVGCDGGVFVSRQNGRAHTFASRCNGLAAVQPTFLSQHPTSSHFVACGFQDAGMQVRSGDTVWEKVALGDGGGTVFHPTRPQHIVSQAFGHGWRKVPDANFTMPTRTNAPLDTENGIALFYSGAAAVATGATTARIAVGTSRVWLTADVGGAATNTWRVIPFATVAPGLAAADPRDNAGNDLQPNFGVPSLVAGDVAGGIGPLGGVVTMRWVTNQHLLVLYANGVVRYVENAGRWTATVVLQTGTQPATSAAAGTTILTDILPVPEGGGMDFYLTTTGDAGNPAVDTCYLFTGGAFVPTGLRNVLPVPPGSPVGAARPIEPAYSVAVDTTAPGTVYVGTVTGVWTRAHPTPPATPWNRFDNGLPQAAVQDLSIWTDPAGAAGSPRLMRAAVQARGVWEVNLAAAEPSRTYVRVHARDDRRIFPTPMANPRRGAGAAEENTFESPDVVVRPRASAGIAPTWRFGAAGRIAQGTTQLYQLWTFQTAFRWIHPSVVADGQWTDTFGDLVELERATRGLPAAPTNPPGQRFIDQALWTAVVGGTRVDPATGLVSGNAAHPLAVYRPAWHTPARTLTGVLRPIVPATEVDLVETVQPRSVVGGIWQVHSEPSTVDILLHHRDMRAVAENGAFAILLHRSGASSDTLLNSPGGDLAAFGQDLAAGNPHATPAGWTLVNAPDGTPLHRLPTTLDARMPRAVSVDVDLTGVPRNHFVLFLAIVASTGDRCAEAPHALPASPTVRQVSRRWPYAALRLVQVTPRPGP